jgi:hypothetical protein
MSETLYSLLTIIVVFGYWYVYLFAYHRGWNAGFDRRGKK